MKAINPYINFNGKCREAMKFYQECLGGDLELQEVKGSPLEEHWSGSMDEILHASLTVNGIQVLMASDMSDQLGYFKGSNFALTLACVSEHEIYQLFEKLANEGRILDPIQEQFWGSLFGALQDKFSIKWMLNYSK
jgi:PhnB protein